MKIFKLNLQVTKDKIIIYTPYKIKFKLCHIYYIKLNRWSSDNNPFDDIERLFR